MSDTSANWSEVGARVTDLGRKLRTHFEQQRAATTPSDQVPPDQTSPGASGTATPTPDGHATVGGGGPAGSPGGDSESDRVHEALRKLGDAVDGVVDALGSAVKDPTIKEDVKQVGTALTGALSTSFAVISDDLRQAFRRRSNPQPDPTPPATPTATATTTATATPTPAVPADPIVDRATDTDPTTTPPTDPAGDR
ncbi:MAG: hypothetical protein ACKV2O_15610 [Acidimicrobiales bacterium]